MQQPVVSIGIPFKDADGTLLCTIQSVFAQTINNWELILVNDASVDRSLAIATAINDPRVRVLSDGIHKGLAARLNEIAKEARAPYLARLDADDAMCPERLERQLEYLHSHPSCDVLGTGMFAVNQEMLPIGVRIGEAITTAEGALRHGTVMHATVVGRTDWFRSNPYNERYLRVEDRELWLRTYFTATYANLPEPLYIVRESDSFSLDKYLRTSSELRNIVISLGPSMVGWPGTIRFYLATLVKDAIYSMARTFSLCDWLVRFRSRPITDSEIAACSSARKTIMATYVPGLATVR